MEKLYIGLLVAGFSLFLQIIWQAWKRYFNKRNMLLALLGECEMNCLLLEHNSRRAGNQIKSALAYQSYIKYRTEKLSSILYADDVSVPNNLRDSLQKMYAQLLHQNEMVDISRSLWEPTLRNNEKYSKEIGQSQEEIDRIVEQSLLSVDNASPIEIFNQKLEGEGYRRLQKGIAEIMLSYEPSMKKMIEDVMNISRKKNKRYFVN